MMSNQTKKVSKPKVKRKYDTSSIIIIGGIIIILIPCLFLAFILFDAFTNTGKPISGDRFANDLNPAITKENQKTIETRLKENPKIEKVSVKLAAATFGIYLDTLDTLTVEEVAKIVNETYSIVTEELPEATYFTFNNNMKMYDLSINVYNLAKPAETDNYIYYVLTKNSTMEKPLSELKSQPIDAALAEELRQDVIDRNKPKEPVATDAPVVGGNNNEE